MKIDKKQAVGLEKEESRLDLLEGLKEVGGPFTNAEEIDRYLSEEKSEKIKKARMKAEMKFAHDSSTTLPRNDPLFRIQVSGKKRRDKTAEEFAVSLKAMFGKRKGKNTITLDRFKISQANVLKQNA